MRAARNGASRAGKSCQALLGSHTALARFEVKQLCCNINPDFLVKMSAISEHSESEFYYLGKKKESAVLICLLTELGQVR